MDRNNSNSETVADVAAALVLSAAALLTSWAAFQSALWDGEQAAAYARAGEARVEAGVLATETGQAEAADLFLFSQWLDAYAQGETDLEAFYRNRFRHGFAPAFEAWLATNPRENPHAPSTPFAMRNYVRPLEQATQSASAKADALFDQGERANTVSDAYVQATVVFALTLFLGGIGQIFGHQRVRLGLSALAAAACFVGLWRILALPTLSL